MEVDRRAFIASLGGVAAVNLMDHEAKAEALEHYMEDKLDEMVAAQQPEKFPTVAEIEAQIETRPLPARHGLRVHRPARAEREDHRADAGRSRRSTTSSACASRRPITCCRARRAR